MLWKNYKIYIFRKKVLSFFLKIKAIKLVRKIYSKYLLRKIINSVIEKIRSIQKFYKFLIFSRYLIKSFIRAELSNKFKKGLLICNLKNKINFIKRKKSLIKSKLQFLDDRKFDISRKIFMKILQKKLHTTYAVRVYYELKIKIKLIILLK